MFMTLISIVYVLDLLLFVLVFLMLRSAKSGGRSW